MFDSQIPIAVISDGLFAAIAAIGFGSISNISHRSFLGCGLLAAIGHMTRFVLMEYVAMQIVPASFFGGLAIGLLAVPVAKWTKNPVESLSFPALLPMIPGMYAYRAVNAIVLAIMADGEESFAHYRNIFNYNALICIIVIIAMALAVTIPIFIFKKVSFSVTRKTAQTEVENR